MRAGPVGVQQHVLHAVVRVQHDENAFAALRDRLEDAVDERPVLVVELNRATLFLEKVAEKSIEIVRDIHVQNTLVWYERCSV